MACWILYCKNFPESSIKFKETLKLQEKHVEYSMWQTSNKRGLYKIYERLIFLSIVWEPCSSFQPCSLSSLGELWKETKRQDSGLFQGESFLLISFTYLALQWLRFSLRKIFLDQKKDSRNISGCWRLDLNVSYFPPLALLFLRFLMIFLEWKHIQTRVWNPKAKNVWYFFPTRVLEPWANKRTPS